MELLQNQQLGEYVSMRIGGAARTVAIARTEQDIEQIANLAKTQNLPLITLGDGTNVVFSDAGFDGIVLINRIKGFEINKDRSVDIAAGENWDEIVEKTVAAGLTGVESMSLVPGTAGATPVNNVGAYGQEISDTLIAVTAYDTLAGEFVLLGKNDCGLSYRTSRFKNEDHGRFIIAQISLQLQKASTDYKAPGYPALQTALADKNIANPTPLDVRNAVIEIRTSKLPDPRVIANCGSFFKNPVVSADFAADLVNNFPNMPHYPAGENVKLAAGWLIEQAELKNYRANGIWVYDKQALVLVNESAKTYADLMQMVGHIQKTVQNKFGVELVPEPELL